MPAKVRRFAAALFVFACIFYAKTAAYTFSRTDDIVLIVDQADFLRDFSNIPKAFVQPFFPASGKGEGYYRPLVTLSFMADAHWSEGAQPMRQERDPAKWGVDPLPFKVTNILLHALASALLFYFFRVLLRSEVLAGVGAALFVVHPALVSCVAWIPGRTDVLFCVFGLGSFLALERYAVAKNPKWLVLGGACFLGALFSKEAAVVLPLLWAGYYYGVARDRRPLLKDPKVIVGALAALVVWGALLLQASKAQESVAITERARVSLELLSVMLMHLGKLVFPYKLSVLAVIPDTPWIPGAVALVAVGMVLLFASALARVRLLFAAAVFLVPLLPTLPVSDFLILENRLYFPAIGVILFALVAVDEFVPWRADERWRKAALATSLAIGGVLAAVAFGYMGDFANPITFTRAAVQQSPHASLAHLNYGIDLFVDGKYDEAEKAFLRAVQLRPGQAVVYNNLGLIYMRRGELARGENYFRQEILYNPSYDRAHYNLGLALQQQGKPDEAASSFRNAVEYNPRNSEAIGELMVYYGQRGDIVEAEKMRTLLEGLGWKMLSPEEAEAQAAKQAAGDGTP